MLSPFAIIAVDLDIYSGGMFNTSQRSANLNSYPNIESVETITMEHGNEKYLA